MSEKKEIKVNDFGLFYDVMKSAVKVVESAKFIVNKNGLQIYGARGRIARCELLTNSIYADEDIDFAIADLPMFIKILSTIVEVHKDDYTGLKFLVCGNALKFESKKFKTKFALQNEAVISKWVSKKVEAQLVPVFEFKTTAEWLKRISSHSFIFSDPSSLRVYIETKSDMEKNTVFATLGNRENNLNNEVTLKLGLVTSGKLDATRKIVVDLERLALFSAFSSSEIGISLMNMNVLVSSTKVSGKNGSYCSFTLYTTILKA